MRGGAGSSSAVMPTASRRASVTSPSGDAGAAGAEGRGGGEAGEETRARASRRSESKAARRARASARSRSASVTSVTSPEAAEGAREEARPGNTQKQASQGAEAGGSANPVHRLKLLLASTAPGGGQGGGGVEVRMGGDGAGVSEGSVEMPPAIPHRESGRVGERAGGGWGSGAAGVESGRGHRPGGTGRGQGGKEISTREGAERGAATTERRGQEFDGTTSDEMLSPSHDADASQPASVSRLRAVFGQPPPPSQQQQQQQQPRIPPPPPPPLRAPQAQLKSSPKMQVSPLCMWVGAS